MSHTPFPHTSALDSFFETPWAAGEVPYPSRRRAPIAWLRAKLLYTVYPYDRSIWQKLRSAYWCFWLALSAWPLWGVQPLFWGCLYLTIERHDEYQLIAFILELKAQP